MPPNIERTVEVRNERGIHLHVAGILAKAASAFESDIWLVKDDLRVNAKSILSITLLAATVGTVLRLLVEGTDAAEAAERIVALFESRFEIQ